MHTLSQHIHTYNKSRNTPIYTCICTWCRPNLPHMHPREDTLKRRTCICTREDTLLSEHTPYAVARARSRATTDCVTREPKRGHPQLTSTCWGPHMHPRGHLHSEHIYMNLRGHPPDEHMPYVSARVHSRGNSGWGVVGCSRLRTVIYKVNIYVHELSLMRLHTMYIYIVYSI